MRRTHRRRPGRAVLAAATAALIAVTSAAITGPVAANAAIDPILDQRLPAYNEIWTTKSTGVTGSMPIGNGIQAANVWVEGSTLKLLLSAGDAWDENVRLAKLGRLDITFSPNPFATGAFRQELKLEEGEIVITSGSDPVITTRVWADANEKALHVESDAPAAFTMQVDFASARPATVTNPSRNNFNFMDLVDTESPYTAAPIPPKVTADTVYERTDKLLWAHRNDTSHFDQIMELQGLDPAEFDDPLTGRTFGGLVQGPGFTTISPTRLVSSAATSQRLDINVESSIDLEANWLDTWENGIEAAAAALADTPIATLRAAHQEYWADFWNRSYIFATGDADADRVTKGWLHTRYTEAIAGRTPNMPIRFNGSLFTPGTSTDADARLWNSYHGFNQRFAYWSMLPSGDFDLMQPYFDQYASSLDLAKKRVEVFWGDGATEDGGIELPPSEGAMWPEVMGLWGHAVGGEYGWNRAGKPANWFSGTWTRYLYANNVELASMMLDYYTYTGDTDFATSKLLPVASEVVKFYDTHWNLSNGKIDMYPMYSGEGDRMLHNPMADTAGLHNTIDGLLALPTSLTTQVDRDYWTAVKGRLPNLPIGSSTTDNDTNYGPNDRMKTAASVFLGSDTNNQNLWPIFPLRMFGNGQPDLDLAVASYNDRRGKYPTNGTQDWRHDATHAAYLGLTDEARYQTVEAFRNGAWRYTGFGPGAGDGEPGNEPRSIGKIALQAMLLHPGAGDDAILFNAWPGNWDVRFKLHTTNGRIVEGSRVAGVVDYGVSPGVGTITVRPIEVAVTTSYTWTAQPSSTALAGDVNGDGKGDIVAWQGADGYIFPRVGDGTGTAFTHTEPTVWAAPGTRFGGDFNGDGKLDVGAWSGSGAGNWKIRYGTGTTFSGETPYSWAAQAGSSLVTGDFNADGKTDLGVWQTDGHFYIRYGVGDGTFGNQTHQSIAHPGASSKITAGDYDGDGDADLAYSTGSGWAVRLGNGTGGFAAASSTISPPGSGSPVSADIDADGKDDLVVWTSSNGKWVTRYDMAASAPAVAPTADVTATSKCIAGKVALSVLARNTAEVPAAVEMTTEHGDKSFASVAPRKNATHAFTVRAAELPGGQVQIVTSAEVDGEAVTNTITVPYAARSCG
ncbi:DUF5703 domain-containing protein [Agromyces italicus]|uniref:DUF5703 domain-containing protein n=1 Tax=Agromyces italicus TaxID=279572 RepID=UPI0004215C43|nr:DUF5703 domain-containing protein [Agromyces italicus]